MAPIVDGLSDEFDGRAAVLRLNVAEPANEALQGRYNVRGHPSFVILDAGGRVTDSFFGPQPEDVLRQALARVTASPE